MMLQENYSTLESIESSIPASPFFLLSHTKLLEYAYRRHPGEKGQVPFWYGLEHQDDKGSVCSY